MVKKPIFLHIKKESSLFFSIKHFFYYSEHYICGIKNLLECTN